MTNVGLNDLRERIRNICIYPPTGLTVEELSCWLRGAEHMYKEVQKVIDEFMEDNADD